MTVFPTTWFSLSRNGLQHNAFKLEASRVHPHRGRDGLRRFGFRIVADTGEFRHRGARRDLGSLPLRPLPFA